MKKASRSLGLALVLILFMSAVPAIQSRADYNPYSAWISVFDPAYYNANNAAAAAYAGGDINRLWQYFVNVGIPKCDQASEEFNVLIYAKNYPELVQAFGGNVIQYYVHYATVGKAAGLNARTLNGASQLPSKNLLDCNIIDKHLIYIDDDDKDSYGNRYYGNHLIGYGEKRDYGSIIFSGVSEYQFLSGIITPKEKFAGTWQVNIYAGDRLVYSSPLIDKYTSPINFDVKIDHPTLLRIETSSDFSYNGSTYVIIANTILHN